MLQISIANREALPLSPGGYPDLKQRAKAGLHVSGFFIIFNYRIFLFAPVRFHETGVLGVSLMDVVAGRG
jgi:hypothetical protein